MSEVKVNKISPRTNCGTVTVGDAGDSVTVTAGVPVTVNGDLKSNALKATDGGNIVSQSGTTITLGASGDTINLAAGASQSGFGRTGTVDWDTTAKTASFTAVSGNGYFVNTTSGAITVTLPASPSAGDIVGFNDYARTFAINNLTIARNGSNIQGVAIDGTISTNGQSTMFVYVDATQGWMPTEDQTTGQYGAQYITATGGTITTSGDYKIHTFTSPGTFTVTCGGNSGGSNSVDYLIVAGGGGGGAANGGGGGGGAGGYRESKATGAPWTASPLATCASLPVSATTYPITVGAGGAGACSSSYSNTNGSNSIFSTITSAGGGKAGSNPAPNGTSGGSGGAGSHPAGSAGSGNTPPVSPPQGSNGGTGAGNTGGGGGGATAAGQNASGCAPVAGAGGAGATSCITGSPVTRAGGGGGNSEGGTGGAGGAGGGGTGASGAGCAASGTANTGGGGGGIDSTPTGRTAGGGGSGIVIIRYKYQ